MQGEIAGYGWAHLAVTSVLWLVIPLAIGVRSVLRSEVKRWRRGLSLPFPLRPRPCAPRRASAVVHTRRPPSVLDAEGCSSPAPPPHEVLARVEAASVNAQDGHLMRGEPRLARVLGHGVLPAAGGAPRVPVRGTDLAGVVVAVGGRERS